MNHEVFKTAIFSRYLIIMYFAVSQYCYYLLHDMIGITHDVKLLASSLLMPTCL